MFGKRYRFLAAVLAAVLFTAVLSGCGKNGKDPKKDLPSSEGFTNDVCMRIGDIEVSYAEANVYLMSMREEVEALYGPEIWDLKFTSDGKAYSELMKERLLEKITYIKLVCAMADEYDVRLGNDEILNITDYTQQYLSNITEETAKKYGITEELVRSIYSDNVLAEKIYQTITLNADTSYSEAEVLRAKFDFIFLSRFYEDSEGNKTPFTSDDMRTLWTKAQSIRAEARAAKDFASYAKSVTEASSVEMTVGRADLPSKSRAAAFALKSGEISEIVEEEDGLYIFFCVSDKDEAATQAATEAKIEELAREYFNSKYEKWVNSVKIEINQALWDAM
ncbi:MAG: peptidyl-prolyl cis-trans isomerase [Lachnospiraceae bacterium]|nr:peptidyl-prolyl cis-trans isomerase [Lachnospiraceae bacterium]